MQRRSVQCQHCLGSVLGKACWRHEQACKHIPGVAAVALGFLLPGPPCQRLRTQQRWQVPYSSKRRMLRATVEDREPHASITQLSTSIPQISCCFSEVQPLSVQKGAHFTEARQAAYSARRWHAPHSRSDSTPWPKNQRWILAFGSRTYIGLSQNQLPYYRPQMIELLLQGLLKQRPQFMETTIYGNPQATRPWVIMACACSEEHTWKAQ